MSVYLTPTEGRIAEQAALGARTHEIADAVELSPRTVEWYLSRIYRKLGVRSRTELAARFAGAATSGSEQSHQEEEER